MSVIELIIEESGIGCFWHLSFMINRFTVECGVGHARLTAVEHEERGDSSGSRRSGVDGEYSRLKKGKPLIGMLIEVGAENFLN